MSNLENMTRHTTNCQIENPAGHPCDNGATTRNLAHCPTCDSTTDLLTCRQHHLLLTAGHIGCGQPDCGQPLTITHTHPV